MRRHRRRLAVLGALAAVIVALAAAHAGFGSDHMADDGVAQAVSICLAVLQVGLGLVAAVLAVAQSPPWHRSRVAARAPLTNVGRGLGLHIRVRAGPPVLQVFLR